MMDGKPTSLPGCPARDDYPVTQRQRSAFGRSGGDDDSPSSSQPGGQRHQLVNVARAAHDDRIESSLEITCTILQSLREHARATQRELANRAREERGATAARLDERDVKVAADNLDRESRQAGAGPQVENRGGGRGKNLEEEQAIEKQMFHDPHRLG